MSAPAHARSGRALLGCCLGLAGAAALLGGASQAVWYHVAPAGRGPVAVAGAAVQPALTGLALLALAGIAALVAVAGPVRRILAGLLGVIGTWVAVVALLDRIDRPGWAQPPPGISADAVRNATTTATPAPLLAVAGGLVLAAVGVFVLVAEPRLPRFGARYAASGARPAPVDPDRAAWVALDEGRDPTADQEPDPGPASAHLGHAPADPGRDPAGPGRDPVDPGRDPVDSGRDPADSGRDPADPGRNPVDPGRDPAESGRDPAESGRDPADPDAGRGS